MNGVEKFSALRNIAKLKEGFKGGPWFKDYNRSPSMVFRPGYPESIDRIMDHTSIKQPTPTSPWNFRR